MIHGYNTLIVHNLFPLMLESMPRAQHYTLNTKNSRQGRIIAYNIRKKHTKTKGTDTVEQSILNKASNKPSPRNLPNKPT